MAAIPAWFESGTPPEVPGSSEKTPLFTNTSVTTVPLYDGQVEVDAAGDVAVVGCSRRYILFT